MEDTQSQHFFIKNKNFLTKQNKSFIENVILSENFPFHLNKYSVNKNFNDNVFTHVILHRPEDRNNNDFNSPYYKECLDIFKNFIHSINITNGKLLRMCVNLTFNNGYNQCHSHIDHNFDHKVALIYLNDPLDKESKTVILDDNEKIINESYPEKYTGICFGNNKHYQLYPKQGIRVVLVVTFSI